MIYSVLANGSPGSGGFPGTFPLENPLGSGTTFVSVINSVLNWLMVYSVPVLALMILIGGFQILNARGEPEKVNNGKKTIWYAVIGFLVILISKGIALIILEIIG